MDTWDLFFMTVVGWQFHPGYLREGAEALSLEECALLADEMVRLKEDRVCRGGQQLQQV